MLKIFLHLDNCMWLTLSTFFLEYSNGNLHLGPEVQKLAASVGMPCTVKLRYAPTNYGEVSVKRNLFIFLETENETKKSWSYFRDSSERIVLVTSFQVKIGTDLSIIRVGLKPNQIGDWDESPLIFRTCSFLTNPGIWIACHRMRMKVCSIRLKRGVGYTSQRRACRLVDVLLRRWANEHWFVLKLFYCWKMTSIEWKLWLIWIVWF